MRTGSLNGHLQSARVLQMGRSKRYWSKHSWPVPPVHPSGQISLRAAEVIRRQMASSTASIQAAGASFRVAAQETFGMGKDTASLKLRLRIKAWLERKPPGCAFANRQSGFDGGRRWAWAGGDAFRGISKWGAEIQSETMA